MLVNMVRRYIWYMGKFDKILRMVVRFLKSVFLKNMEWIK